MSENRPSKNPFLADREYYVFALGAAGDFGITIAIPVIIFTILGTYFDDKYGTHPLFVSWCLVISALLTIKIIYRKAKHYGEEFKKLK